MKTKSFLSSVAICLINTSIFVGCATTTEDEQGVGVSKSADTITTTIEAPTYGTININCTASNNARIGYECEAEDKKLQSGSNCYGLGTTRFDLTRNHDPAPGTEDAGNYACLISGSFRCTNETVRPSLSIHCSAVEQ